MGDFKRLVAWQKAHAFELAVHDAFKGRRLAAAPGFRGQLLRAVGSIPDNLAEGCGKRSRRAFRRVPPLLQPLARSPSQPSPD